MHAAVAPVLAAWWAATARDAAVWSFTAADRPPTLLAATRDDAPCARRAPAAADDDLPARAAEQGWQAFRVVDGTPSHWLVVEGDASAVSAGDARDRDSAGAPDAALAALLERTVATIARLVRERDGATNELAERYEEISLLYAIGELLGGSRSVEAVADTVLRELAVTVGAPRGAVMLHDAARDVLTPIALLGLSSGSPTTVRVDDPARLAARVFREGETIALAGGEEARQGAPVLAHDGGPVLLVPVSRSGREGGEPLGVLLLAGRPGDAPFSAGDRKLVTAVASQVGTALHNARLVQIAVAQEQRERELRLASDLQLTLLPSPRVVGIEARAAARVVPAEEVGGDFYLLARLDADRTAVLIGDVSGHGYRAALVMALAMSAAAIHVQGVRDPGETMATIAESILDELERTEMSIALCYAVIDEARGAVRWANAGHPHAFVLHADGTSTRLGAQLPPLGLGPVAAVEDAVPWHADDRLLLFTDGLPDLRDDDGRRLGEPAVLAAAASSLRADGGVADADATLAAIFAHAEAHRGREPLRDDLTAVVLERRYTPTNVTGVHAVPTGIAAGIAAGLARS